jgi:hypothetical protein
VLCDDDPKGMFTRRFDDEALTSEEDLLAGRYVLTTSLGTDETSATDVVHHYRMLQKVEGASV